MFTCLDHKKLFFVLQRSTMKRYTYNHGEFRISRNIIFHLAKITCLPASIVSVRFGEPILITNCEWRIQPINLHKSWTIWWIILALMFIFLQFLWLFTPIVTLFPVIPSHFSIVIVVVIMRIDSMTCCQKFWNTIRNERSKKESWKYNPGKYLHVFSLTDSYLTFCERQLLRIFKLFFDTKQCIDLVISLQSKIDVFIVFMYVIFLSCAKEVICLSL